MDQLCLWLVSTASPAEAQAHTIKLDWNPSRGERMKPASIGPKAAPTVLNKRVTPALFIRLATCDCTQATIAGSRAPERNATGNINARASSPTCLEKTPVNAGRFGGRSGTGKNR